MVATPTFQKVAIQEPALRNKGKGKEIDVTNVPSSSTSISFLPMLQTTSRMTRPKVIVT